MTFLTIIMYLVPIGFQNLINFKSMIKNYFQKFDEIIASQM